MNTISIRPPATIKDYEAIEQLQIDIWGSDLGVAPLHLVLTIAKEGGVVLMAFDDELPVGFVYGFLGLTQDNRLKLASHQAGVLPAYQDCGLGYQLKLAQREAALAKNLDLVTWTYDPLQGRNGRLNLRKLGAVCKTYIPNLYGEMSDALNQGLPSDRFRVDWWIATEYVAQRLENHNSRPEPAGADYPILNPATLLDNGFLAPADTIVSLQGHCCLVEVPVHVAALKQGAPHLALQWRQQTRDIFEAAFSQGYTVTDLIRQDGRNYYLLEKDWQPI